MSSTKTLLLTGFVLISGILLILLVYFVQRSTDAATLKAFEDRCSCSESGYFEGPACPVYLTELKCR